MGVLSLNNIGKVKIQTVAQWAADATVYSAYHILISSDATYGTTDQRKYKVSNGVDTWSNLDYFPANEFSAVMALVFSGFSVGANSPIVDGITIATAFARIQGQINARATLSSPSLTGTPTAPTASAGNNSTQLATTAFVQQEILGIGSDWELVDSASAANDATIDFTGLNSTYQSYVVIIANYIPQTDNTSISLRTSTDGGATYAATAGDYNRALFLVTGAGGNTVSGSVVDTGIPIVGACGTGAGETANAIVNLFKPSATTYFQVNFSATQYSATPEYRVSFGGGIRVASADVDAIRFIPSSGNAASGEFRLYGIKNA